MKLILLYHLRRLSTQRWGATATVLSVALVVGVFCYTLAFADGLRRTLTVSADARNLIILAEGATAESNSAVSHDDVVKLSGVPHVATDGAGRPLVSPEVVVQTNVLRRGDESGALAGVAVRGVEPAVALAVRPSVQLVSGRWFRAGSDELTVGGAAARQFSQGSIGAKIDCGERRFEVVGIFSADGAVHESEFWGYISNVAAAYRRDLYSNAILRLVSEDETVSREVESRVASAVVGLRAVRQEPYYAAQSENARIVKAMAVMILTIMGVGAVFAAVNVMHSALAARTREIGMLLAVGFSRRGMLARLIAESLTMAVAGGLLGCAVTALLVAVGGGHRDLVGTTTFTSVAFSVRIGAAHVGYSLLAALAVGFLGGFWPAHCATRISVVASLRAA